MKIVIWGFGRRGKRLFREIPKEYIYAIIDDNEDLWGKINDIDIIGYSEYKKRNVDNIIIVTIKDFENKIFEEMMQEDRLNSVNYSDVLNIMMNYSAEFFNKIMDMYLLKEKIVIYGYNLFGILLYFSFKKRGYEAYFMENNSLDEDVKTNIHKKNFFQFWDKEVDPAEKYKIILSQPLERDEVIDDNNLNVSYEKYYNIYERAELFQYEELKDFKDCHKGERCFIVATGPSLRIEDLDTLSLNNEVCISMNSIFIAFDKTKWRPQYYVASDYYVIQSHKSYIISDSNKDIKKFICDLAADEEIFSKENVFKWHLACKYYDDIVPEFSDDFFKGSSYGTTVTYDGALQLVAYMGFKEIYLLGVDCNNYTDSKQHFTEYKHGQTYLDIRGNILAYKSAKKYADEHGIKIYNATRGGKLEVFERVNFDDLF